MAKILTAKDFKEYLNKVPRNFIQKEEDGELEVKFLGHIQAVEPGDTDLSGRVWNPQAEWTKHEIEAEINGRKVIYSLGGERSPLLLRIFEIAVDNDISPEDIPGTRWKISRQGNTWNVVYLGKDNQSADSSSIIEAIKEVISAIKEASPEYFKNPVSTDEFVTAITIKSYATGNKLEKEKVRAVLDDLVNAKVIEYTTEDKSEVKVL